MAIIHVHGPFIFFYIFLIISPLMTSSLTESEALLKLKQSFTNPKGLDSWQPGSEPCAENKHWDGVLCLHGKVFGLRLGHMGLSGRIDVEAMASLSGLRSVAFMSNAFTGQIPDFHRLEALKALYLSENQFLGEISSDYFKPMQGLKKVWLSRNNFTGPVPSSLSGLSGLMELHVEDNRFSGTIPPLNQESLASFNVSNNNLEGEIPSGLLAKFNASAFQGNAGLCGRNSGGACEKEKHNGSVKIAIWFFVAFAAVLLLMVVGIFVMRRRNQSTSDRPRKENLDDNRVVRSSSGSVGKRNLDCCRRGFGSGHRAGPSDLVMLNDEKGEIRLSDLMKASAEVLGAGVMGSSFKAMMDNGLVVVVKRMKEMSKLGREKFDGEMKRFSSLQHKNVLTPIAYQYRKEEKLLVHEYQQKGSLLFLLHGDRGFSQNELTWPVRVKIIQGIARGLGYLHAELSSFALPHGNLKSSNVLLARDHEPLLVDYGYCALISSNNRAAQSLAAYKSPEAMSHQLISPKCDVYCLGIMILEILTGKFPSLYLNNAQGETYLIQWVKSAVDEGREASLIDPTIAKAVNFLGEIRQLLQVGVACAEPNTNQRLDLKEAIRRIEGIKSNQKPKTSDVLPSSREGHADQVRATTQPNQATEIRDTHSSLEKA